MRLLCAAFSAMFRLWLVRIGPGLIHQVVNMTRLALNDSSVTLDGKAG